MTNVLWAVLLASFLFLQFLLRLTILEFDGAWPRRLSGLKHPEDGAGSHGGQNRP